MLQAPCIANAKTQLQGGDIPQKVWDKAQQKVDEDAFTLPETKAWEEDLKGNVKEVTPLNQRSDVYSTSDVIRYSIPDDGYTYEFQDYEPASKATRVWHYDIAGIYRVSNKTASTAHATYTQQSSTDVKWSVGSNISGNATIGTSFLGKVEVSLGANVSRDKSYTAGKSYGVSQTIPAKTTVYITNYTVGANSSGKLWYKKYAGGSTGTYIGNYYESAGGTCISDNDINIEITSREPAN